MWTVRAVPQPAHPTQREAGRGADPAHLAQDDPVSGREHLSVVSHHLVHHSCRVVRCGTEAQNICIIVQTFDMGVLLVVD